MAGRRRSPRAPFSVKRRAHRAPASTRLRRAVNARRRRCGHVSWARESRARRAARRDPAPTRVARRRPCRAPSGPSTPSPSTAGCRATRPPRWSTLRRPRRRARAGRALGEGRVEPAGAARRSRCSGPRGRPTGCSSSGSARSRRGRTSTSCAAAVAAARAAHAGGRHRRQPRPGRRPHGPAARARRPHPRAGRDRGRPHRRHRLRGRGGRRWSTAPTTTPWRPAPPMARDDVLVISDTSWEGYTEVPSWVIEGYSTIFAEVDEQLAPVTPARRRRRPDGRRAPWPPPRSSHVRRRRRAPRSWWSSRSPPRAGSARPRPATRSRCPAPTTRSWPGSTAGLVSVVAWPTVAAGIDVFVAVDDGAAERAMRDLASVDVVAGETGAAGLAGLRALVESGASPVDLAGRSVLVICTEGATDPVAYERIVSASGRQVGSGCLPGGRCRKGNHHEHAGQPGSGPARLRRLQQGRRRHAGQHLLPRHRALGARGSPISGDHKGRRRC